MGNEIRAEFEEFIDVLSKEICKEVLLEDLKSINASFDKTSKDYDVLYDKYTNNINSISKDMDEIMILNDQTRDMILKLDDSNTLIKESLNTIYGGHEKVINNIITDNKMLFNKYNSKIIKLNSEEREKFISELALSMNEYSQKFISDMKKTLNSSDLKKVSADVETILVDTGMVYNEIDNISVKQNKLLEVIAEKVDGVEEKINTEAKQLIYENNQAKEYIDSNFSELEDKLDKINSKNNLIIFLLLILIFIFFIYI